MKSFLSRALGAVIVVIVCAAIGASCNTSSPIEVDPTFEAATIASRFEVSPLQIDFGDSATSAKVILKNNSGTRISWTASEDRGWLSLGATSGTVLADSRKGLSLSVQRSGKAAGEYTTNVKITPNDGSGSEIVAVRMTVPSAGTATATFAASPVTVDFGTTGTSASVTLTNNGNQSLTWTASESKGWLTLGATSGTIAAKSKKTLSMSANRTGRSAGTYTTNVIFAAGTADSVTASVSMTVLPTSGSVLLAGQLVDQFDGHPLAGLTVQFDGKSVQTNGSGIFTIAGSPSSTLEQLTLSGNGVYRRVTFARTGDSRWQVVPSNFNMAAYNDLARDDYGASTIRWVAPPTVYIDSRPKGFTSAELSTWISQVKVQAAEFVSKWSGAVIEPSAVIVTSSPPAIFTPGTIVIHFSDNSSDFGGSSLAIGYARLTYSFDRSIPSAAVWLRYPRYSGTSWAGKRKGILGHELGHAMGYGHMSMEVESFMQPSLGTKTDLSAFDVRAASLSYSRSPENTSPDIDSWGSYRGILVPSGLLSAKEWICGAEDGFTGSSR